MNLREVDVVESECICTDRRNPCPVHVSCEMCDKPAYCYAEDDQTPLCGECGK